VLCLCRTACLIASKGKHGLESGTGHQPGLGSQGLRHHLPAVCHCHLEPDPADQLGPAILATQRRYFSLRRSAKPLLAIALILLLTLAGVRLDVVLSNWSNGLYTSLQQLNESLFWSFVRIFCILASLHVLRSLFSFYVNQSFSIHWRAWLNEQLLQKLLQKQAFYRLQYLPQHSDNPDQRIQQDVSSFVSSSLGLSMGVVSALVSTLAYTLILWNLSGPLQLLGWKFRAPWCLRCLSTC
jgi:putative ATP-binding cassette transporter